MRRRSAGRWLLAVAWLVLLLQPGVVAAAPSLQGGTHTVQRGETLFSIAQKYGVTVDDIVRANQLTNANIIAVGQELKIPGAAANDGQGETTAAAAGAVHKVAAGETLSSIAAQYGVTAEAIAAASGIRVSDLLLVGQELIIPGEAETAAEPSAAVAMAAPAPEPIPDIYTVRPGDTLASIAQRFGTSPAALARANRLSSPALVFVGRRLVIPQPKILELPPADLRVEVSISRQHCWVYKGETVILDWICSTGRPSSPTQAGSFAIQSKIRKAYGSSWNIWMPYWLGVYWAGGTENGFHGLPWNARTGRETWTGLVGTKITYGCVMLTNPDSETLWNMAYIGLPVEIFY